MKFTSNIYKLKDAYKKLSVPQFTIVTGLFIICLGTLILSSPLCSSSKVGLWEAFFTSTSAITVTGLTIIDIGVDLNFFGQVFLAFMLLSGGLGLMAITTFLQGFVVKGTKLRTRLDKGKTLDEFGVGGIGRTFQSIAITATCIISLGAIVFLLFQLPGNAFSEDIITNSNSMSEENIESIPVVNDSLDTEDKPDNSYDINGTFVGNDEQ